MRADGGGHRHNITYYYNYLQLYRNRYTVIFFVLPIRWERGNSLNPELETFSRPCRENVCSAIRIFRNVQTHREDIAEHHRHTAAK